MPESAFADLLEAPATDTAGAFDDLLTPRVSGATTGAFDDLIGDSPTAGPAGTLGGIGASFQRGRLGALRAIEAAGMTAGGPTMGQGRRAFEQAMRDPAYMPELMGAGEDPAKLARAESLFGPGRRLDTMRTPIEEGRTARATEIGDLSRQMEAIPQSEAMQRWAAADNTNWWKVFASDPFEITANIFAESAPAAAVSMAGAMTAGPAGAGAASYAVETANALVDAAGKAGVDLTDPDQVRAFFSDEGKLKEARKFAQARGFPIAMFDALTAGVAGKFLKPALGQGLKKVAKATGAELAVQMAGGALGETGAQVASGQPLSAKDIAAEAIGELATAPGEIVSNLRGEAGTAKSQASEGEKTGKGEGEKKLADAVEVTRDALAELQAVLRGESPESGRLKKPEAPAIPAEAQAAGQRGRGAEEKRGEPTGKPLTAAEAEGDKQAREFLAKRDKDYAGMTTLELELLEGLGDLGARSERKARMAKKYLEQQTEPAAELPTSNVERSTSKDLRSAIAEAGAKDAEAEAAAATPPPSLETLAPASTYTIADAANDAGGIGVPKLDEALASMEQGRTAAQVVSDWAGGRGEYDALADVLEQIRVAAEKGRNSRAFRALAEAYRRAFREGGRQNIDQTLSGLEDARQQGHGPEGGTPDSSDSLIGRVWDFALGRGAPRQLTAQEQSIRLHDVAASNAGRSATQNGGEGIQTDELRVGDKFLLRGTGLEVAAIDPDTGAVRLRATGEGRSSPSQFGERPELNPEQAPRVYPDKGTFVPIDRGTPQAQTVPGESRELPRTGPERALAALNRAVQRALGRRVRIVAAGTPSAGAAGVVHGTPAAPGGKGPSATAQRARRVFERVFKRRIVVVRQSDGGQLPFHGATLPNQPGYLFIAEDSMNGPTVLGHEFLESLASENPALFERLRAEMVPLMREFPEYRARLNAMERAAGATESGDVDAQRELIADFVGDCLSDPKFLAQLSRSHPSLFQKLAAALQKWLYEVADKLRPYGANRWFADVERAQGIVAGALREFAENGKTGKRAEGQRGKGAEAPARFSLSDEQRKAFDHAAGVHGLTDDVMEAGYVLPDGRMLDFSGRFQMQDSYEKRGDKWVPKAGNRDYQRGVRHVDHREIEFPGMPSNGSDAMIAFQKLGGMRISASTGFVDMEAAPTPEQVSRIRQIADLQGDDGLVVDLADGSRKASVEGSNVNRILGAIRRFYRGEDIRSGTRFSLRDTNRELNELQAIPAAKRTTVQEQRIRELQAQLGQGDLFDVQARPGAEVDAEKERQRQREKLEEGRTRRLTAGELESQRDMFGKPGQQALFSLRDTERGQIVGALNNAKELGDTEFEVVERRHTASSPLAGKRYFAVVGKQSGNAYFATPSAEGAAKRLAQMQEASQSGPSDQMALFSLRDRMRDMDREFRAMEARGEQVPPERLEEYAQMANEMAEEIRAGRERSEGLGGSVRQPRAVVDRGLEGRSENEKTGKREDGPFKGEERLPGGSLRDVFTGLNSWRRRAREWWSRWDMRQSAARGKDSADNRADIAGNMVANHIRLALNRAFDTAPGAVRHKHELREYALAFAIEADGPAGGGLANLEAMKNQILESDFAGGKWARRAVAAIDYAEANWDRLQPIVDQYAQLTTAQREMELNHGVNSREWEGGYVHHSWKEVPDGPAGGVLADGGAVDPNEPRGAATPFRRRREYATLADGLAAGGVPKSLNAVELLSKRIGEGQRKLNEIGWIEVFKKTTDPVSGEPVVLPARRVPDRPNVPRGERAEAGTEPEPEAVAQAQPANWVRKPLPGYVAMKIGDVEVDVHRGFDSVLTDLTSESWFKGSPGRRLARNTFGLAKSVTLLFDTFHLGRLAAWKTILTGKPTYGKGLTLLDYSEADIREMARRGEVPEGWVDDLVENKRKLGLALRTGLNVGGVVDNMAADLVHGLPGIGRFNHFLFREFQRGAVTEAWLLEFNRLRRAMPEASEVDVARRVSADLNVRFGNLGRQGLFKSRTAQDLARLVFLAPQWNEGLIRSELGALRDLVRLPKDSIRHKRLVAGTLLKGTGLMLLGTFLANQLLNWITRGKPTWDNEEEGWEAKLSAYIPDTIGKSPGFFLNPMALPAEYTHLIAGNLHRSKDMWDAAKRILHSRLHGPTRAGMMLFTREDELGRKLRPGEVTAALGKALIPVPIGAGSIYSAAKQLVTGEPSEQYEGQFEKQVLSSLGVKTDKVPSGEQRIRALARAFNAEKGIVPSAEYYTGDYDDLMKALRIGNQTDARDALEELLQKKTARQVNEHFRRWVSAPYTGQVRREGEFMRSLTPEQRAAYVASRDARRELARQALGLLRERVTNRP